MNRIEVFDPPMCCSTGICGPKVDPVLLSFAADLHWLAGQGVAVERYNLAQQPQAFASSEVVRVAMERDGTECLPVILANGSIVSKGSYPKREELARLAGVKLEQTPEESLEKKHNAVELPVVNPRCCG